MLGMPPLAMYDDGCHPLLDFNNSSVNKSSFGSMYTSLFSAVTCAPPSCSVDNIQLILCALAESSVHLHCSLPVLHLPPLALQEGGLTKGVTTPPTATGMHLTHPLPHLTWGTIQWL